MIWPQTVCHVIDENSPLYKYSECDLIEKRFEIVVGLKGDSHYSGHTTQSRTSFISQEILWGHRFKNLVSYDPNDECYFADVDLMDETDKVSMPSISAYEYDKNNKIKNS
jgi:potassium inwardly-rectifying channel subfamily J